MMVCLIDKVFFISILYRTTLLGYISQLFGLVPLLICHYFTIEIFSVKQQLYLLPLKRSNREHVNNTWK